MSKSSSLIDLVQQKNKFGQIKLGQIKKLLKSDDEGVDINQKDVYGWTALMYAAKFGNKKLVGLLFDNGADETVEDLEGNDAYQIALNFGHKNTAKALQKKISNSFSNPNYKRERILVKRMAKRLDDINLQNQDLSDEDTIDADDVRELEAERNVLAQEVERLKAEMAFEKEKQRVNTGVNFSAVLPMAYLNNSQTNNNESDKRQIFDPTVPRRKDTEESSESDVSTEEESSESESSVEEESSESDVSVENDQRLDDSLKERVKQRIREIYEKNNDINSDGGQVGNSSFDSNKDADRKISIRDRIKMKFAEKYGVKDRQKSDNEGNNVTENQRSNLKGSSNKKEKPPLSNFINNYKQKLQDLKLKLQNNTNRETTIDSNDNSQSDSDEEILRLEKLLTSQSKQEKKLSNKVDERSDDIEIEEVPVETLNAKQATLNNRQRERIQSRLEEKRKMGRVLREEPKGASTKPTFESLFKAPPPSDLDDDELPSPPPNKHHEDESKSSEHEGFSYKNKLLVNRSDYEERGERLSVMEGQIKNLQEAFDKIAVQQKDFVAYRKKIDALYNQCGLSKGYVVPKTVSSTGAKKYENAFSPVLTGLINFGIAVRTGHVRSDKVGVVGQISRAAKLSPVASNALSSLFKGADENKQTKIAANFGYVVGSPFEVLLAIDLITRHLVAHHGKQGNFNNPEKLAATDLKKIKKLVTSKTSTYARKQIVPFQDAISEVVSQVTGAKIHIPVDPKQIMAGLYEIKKGVGNVNSGELAQMKKDLEALKSDNYVSKDVDVSKKADKEDVNQNAKRIEALESQSGGVKLTENDYDEMREMMKNMQEMRELLKQQQQESKIMKEQLNKQRQDSKKLKEALKNAGISVSDGSSGLQVQVSSTSRSEIKVSNLHMNKVEEHSQQLKILHEQVVQNSLALGNLPDNEDNNKVRDQLLGVNVVSSDKLNDLS